MDVVYVVRPGSNEELRYSLRSLAANLPHEDVWIVGHAPEWVTGCHILETPQRWERRENVRRNWSAVLADRELPGEFVVMNDDFFVMHPLDVLPVWHRGRLAEHATGAGLDASGYGLALRRTDDYLRGLGHDDAFSYELHIPVAVQKSGWSAAIGAKKLDNRLAPRSIYGNLVGLGGVRADDVKVAADGDAIPHGPFLSTNEAAFTAGEVGKLIREAFPEPGPYEVRR